MMKKKIIGIFVLIMSLSMGTAFALPEGIPDAERLYKFNIIGKQNPKNVNMDQGSGKVIFVNLNEPSQINLVCSDDEEVLGDWPDLEPGSFDILDKDATDSGKNDLSPGAILALPDPGLDPYVVGEKGDADTWSNYSIYIRSLGKPGGFATITTCADILEGPLADWLDRGDIKILNRAGVFGGVASIEKVGQAITERPKGKSIFTNVTAELLTIVLEVEIWVDDGEGGLEYFETIYVRIPIFNEMLEGEYWEYDNNGLKLLQVWIYDNPTDVSEDDDLI
jgi:hypothetical protein